MTTVAAPNSITTATRAQRIVATVPVIRRMPRRPRRTTSQPFMATVPMAPLWTTDHAELRRDLEHDWS